MYSKIIALFLVFVCATPVHAESIQAFLLLGQSNMFGRGVIAQLKQHTIPKNAEVWVQGQKLKSFSDVPNFGPEYSFIQQICGSNPSKKFLFVKYSKGGTTLAVDWHPSVHGSLLWQAIDSYRKAVASRDVMPVGVIWEQGESDALKPEYIPSYAANLELLIDTIRIELKTDVKFFMGLTDWPKAPLSYQIAQAQINVTKLVPNVYAVATCGLPRISVTNPHYNNVGLLGLGFRFATEWQNATN